MSDEVPEGYYFVLQDVVIPMAGQCYEIAIYENGKGEKWGRRWPITREQARNIVESPFWRPKRWEARRG